MSAMSAQILDGKALASKIKGELAIRVTELKSRGITPGLGTVLVVMIQDRIHTLVENIATAKKLESIQYAWIYQIVQVKQMLWRQLKI